MDFKPEVMDKLLAQSDERLWEMIRKVGAMNNISLPSGTPPAAEMQRLRTLLRSGTFDRAEAMRILNAYQRGEKP